PLRPPLFPYTTLFRSKRRTASRQLGSCQATASPRRTLLARRAPAMAATWLSSPAAVRRVLPSTILSPAPPAAESRASSEGTSHGDRKSTRLNSSHVKI